MYHENWFKNGMLPNDTVSVLPLTPDKIQAVASQMIHGGYRSVANYVSRAKDMHIAAEWPWTDSLAREARLANAAAKRGIGPAHQCQELPVEQAWRIAKSLEEMEGHSARHPKWPAGADRYVTVCSFYLLREIESTILRCRDVTFDHEQQTVSVALSVSKTDPQAIGCIRTWGCVCGKRNAPCPYHAAWVQHEYLLCQYADEQGELPTEQVFFPSNSGNVLEKEDVIVMVETLAKEMGLPLVGPDGRKCYGGHVWRISGSRYMGARGIDIRIIKLLARWQSEIVMRYLQEAPLKVITDTFLKAEASIVQSAPKPEQTLKRKAASDEMEASDTEEDDTPLDSVCAVTKFAEEQMQIMLEQVNMAEAEAQELRKITSDLEQKIVSLQRTPVQMPALVVNNNGLGAVHRNVCAWALEPPGMWRAQCGWKYAAANFVRTNADITTFNKVRLCDRCFSTEKLALVPV